MKKTFFTNLKKGCLYVSLCLLGLFFSGVVSAQEAGDGGSTNLTFGVKFGTTMSRFTNEQPHNNIIQGLTSGVFVEYLFKDNMGIQAEALYAQEGGRQLYFDMPFLVGQENYYMVNAENQKIVLHNINIPVLFKYKMLFNNFNLNAVIGPELRYTMKAVDYKEATLLTEIGSFHTYKENVDVTSNIDEFSIAATAGVGIEIPAGKFKLLIDGRYSYGLTPSYKSYSYVGIPQINSDLRFHTLFLTVGIGF